MAQHSPKHSLACAVRRIVLVSCWLLGVLPAWAQNADAQAHAQALESAADTVVGLRAQAVDNATSARTLGQVRQGSGVVIGNDGLVLTIGYLVLEAEQVQLLLDDGRKLPARVVAYDLATGLALVQSLAPLKITPAPLGQSAGVKIEEPLLMASGMQDGEQG